eukprot:CAMPEP_0201997870 /NCGR_PEP_ID=MMETSP0905-20130828/4760_1 /ASSEMBLY_ACC=CAM_ASM_000554 /TAXON_ID=420261 /ORGANISM="Thalassiosira antarctica, Strain CCMP982" /LENGTH=48 /DNA_ID= /DNA_START= /DNA_END= /DNA_ORIENTATION=
MMLFRSSIAVALLAANAANVSADSADSVSSSLQVHVPQTLFRAGGYDH